MVRYFTGYSKTKSGYCVILGDTAVTSVHVPFDEAIPENFVDYFRDLDEATVKAHLEEQQVRDFDWLMG